MFPRLPRSLLTTNVQISTLCVKDRYSPYVGCEKSQHFHGETSAKNQCRNHSVELCKKTCALPNMLEHNRDCMPLHVHVCV